MHGLEALALAQTQNVMRSWDRPSRGDWAATLATFPLFSGISKRRLRKLVRNATFAEFGRGDTIVSNASSADALYVILGGSAKALRKSAPQTLGAGDYFGELALINRTPRPEAVVATEELHVMKLPAQSVVRLARQHPAITLTILRNLSTQLRHLETQAATAA